MLNCILEQKCLEEYFPKCYRCLSLSSGITFAFIFFSFSISYNEHFYHGGGKEKLFSFLKMHRKMEFLSDGQVSSQYKQSQQQSRRERSEE